MTIIRIGQRNGSRRGSFSVRVSFGDDAEYDLEITDPADEATEAILSWYFKEHLRYPFLDADRERLAQSRLVAYGHRLFEQLFGTGAAHDYRSLRDRGFDG